MMTTSTVEPTPQSDGICLAVIAGGAAGGVLLLIAVIVFIIAAVSLLGREMVWVPCMCSHIKF